MSGARPPIGGGYQGFTWPASSLSPTNAVTPPSWVSTVRVQFEPQWRSVARSTLGWRLRRRLPLGRQASAHYITEYVDLVERALARPAPSYLRWPGVTPGWDNSVRRSQGAVIIKNSSPQLFETWIHAAAERAAGLHRR